MGSSPTELGVVRPKTANAIGLLPVKKSPARLSERSPQREGVIACNDDNRFSLEWFSGQGQVQRVAGPESFGLCQWGQSGS
jgi:hypothetical protein